MPQFAKEFPSAVFWPYHSQYPHVNDGVYANQVSQWKVINDDLLSNFKVQCIEWTNKCKLAFAAKEELPPKPLAHQKTIVLRSGDDLANPTDFTSGMWIAVVQDGPIGICPDFVPDPPQKTLPGGVDPKDRPPSNDQLFASLEFGLAELKTILDKIAAKLEIPK